MTDALSKSLVVIRGALRNDAPAALLTALGYRSPVAHIERRNAG
jgi:hypothetical protein